MMRWIVASSLYFRYLIIAFALTLMVVGTLLLEGIPMDVFPEFAPPIVEIQTETPGLSTEEVESLVTIQLEAALNSTPNLDTMRSKSVPGLSQITMIFKSGIDEVLARQQVQERLNVAIKNLPTWAGIPWILQPLSATSRVMHIGIKSNKYSLTDLSMITYWTIRWRLMAVPGVANVVIWGDRFKQMQVQIDPNKLQLYKITLDDAQDAVSNALDFGLLKFTDAAKTRVGGFIETDNQRLPVQHVLPVIEPADLAKVPIPEKSKAGGATITLGDIGNVVWGHQPIIGRAVIGGDEGLLLIVEKFPWANTLDVTRGVEAALKQMQPGLPGIEINPNLFRPASFIEMAVNNLQHTLIISCLLVMLVLGAFLYEWRTTLISLIAIPLSLVTAGVVLDFCNMTINTMILAGFVIAIGGVVDDAIIDVENIVRRLRLERKKSNPRPTSEVILDASLEVRGAIIYAVLIDVVVLLPVFFLTGVSGAFFKPLVIAYMLALLSSMVVALTVTPALCLLLLPHAPLERRESPLLKWLQSHYNHIMGKLISTKKPVYITISMLILVGLLIVPFLGESLFPVFKERYFLNHWVTYPGTSSDEVLRMTKLLSHELRAVPGVLDFGSHIGRAVQGEEIAGINFAENWINIDEKVDYNTTIKKIEDVIQTYPGMFHDVQTYLNERIDEVVAGTSYPITVRIFGPELDVLRSLAEKVKTNLQQIDGTKDIHTELQVEIPHIQVKVDTVKANKYGLKPGDVRRSAATLIAGTEVSDIHRGAKVYDIMVWGTPATRESLQSVQNLLISAPTGEQVKLSDLAQVAILPTSNLIERENNSRRIDVLLDTNFRDISDVANDVQEHVANMEFPLGYYAQVLGEYEERQSAQTLLLEVGLFAALLVLLLLQSAFKSWRLAFLAFFTLPSALVGGLIAAILTGGIVSLGSLVGFFTVFGIAARNGIMLINHYQYIEEIEGEPFGPTLALRGAKERLAPILMTALSAGLALVPLIFYGDIPGQEIEYPMAIVILGGLFTSTLLNLFILPQLYIRFARPRIQR